MRKHLNKFLRIKGMKFYFVGHCVSYGNIENFKGIIEIKTKKRLKELMKSNNFIYDIKSIRIDHINNKTYIYRNKETI